MDENGFLFHRGPQKTGNVALIKSPGLAEEIYSKLEFDCDGNLEYYELPKDKGLQTRLELVTDSLNMNKTTDTHKQT